MLEKLNAVANRYEELCAKSEQPDFYSDPQKASKLLREKTELEPIVDAYRAYRRAVQEMEEAQELMSDPEMKELCQQTFASAKEEKEALYRQLQILLLPKDPNDEKSVIVEIRGGVCAVEWSERVPEAMAGALTVTIEKLGDTSRRVTIEGGQEYEDLSL